MNATETSDVPTLELVKVRADLEQLVRFRNRGGLSPDECRRYVELTTLERTLIRARDGKTGAVR
jgi:hypothetical protein